MLEALSGTAYTMTAEERVTLGKILQRYERMRSARSIVDRYWQTAMLQYEAQYVPYADGRARSNVPLEWAIVELFVSEASSRDSTQQLKAVGETDIKKVEAMRRVLDYVKTQYGIKKELYKNEYLTAIIGTGFYLTKFAKNSRIVNDTRFDALGKPIYTKRQIDNNQIQIKAVDPRYVYLDDRTNDFADDNDQIYIDYITPEELQSMKLDPTYKNIDSVKLFQKTDTVFWTNEERWKMNNEIIERLHYFNKASDSYTIIANRSTIIRETPLPSDHKELPIVPRQYGYNPLSKYGRWLCEALLPFKSNINNLQEMIMDGLYRSNNSTFVIGNGMTFDGQSFGFNNTTVTVNGPVGPDNFQEIRGQAPNQAIFTYLQDLLQQVAIFVGIDASAIIGQPDSTAFEAGLRQDTWLKRVNVALMNRDMALTEVYRRHVSDVMQYFPLKLARWVLEVVDGKEPEGTYPTIILKDEKMVWWEFVQELWDFPFQVSPDMIRGQYDIEVTTNFNAPTVKTIRMARYKEFITNIGQIAEVMMIPEMADKIKFSDLIDEMAFDMDIDIESIGGMQNSLKKQKDELMKKVQMIAWVPEWAPQLPASWVPWATQPDASAWKVRENIWGISTPMLPTISGINKPAWTFPE